MEGIIRNIFVASVNSVKPKNLIGNIIQRNIRPADSRDVIRINSGNRPPLEIDITDKQCHLVGFGKAVLGMSVQMENILKNKLVSGIISAPLGIQNKFSDDTDMQFMAGSVVEVYEGAENNLPDQAAEDVAKRIRKRVKNLKSNDVLFVLVSGGGSALLPLPIAPVTLDEKLNVIKNLTSRGATIEELNAVRIAISELKGGKLAMLGKNAHQIVSLIISDIIDDPLDLIASGPTIPFNATKSMTAKEILHKFDLWENIPKSVKIVISRVTRPEKPPSHSDVVLIGSNKVAINAAYNEAVKNQIKPVIISHSVNGEVGTITKYYIQLSLAIKMHLAGLINRNEFYTRLIEMKDTLSFDSKFLENITETIASVGDTSPICLLAGGEPTVNVVGSGKGGRNQELALRYALESSKIDILRDCMILSAGTDGIDGPTIAAGAIGKPQIVRDRKTKTDILASLENSDTFHFYRNFENGNYHVITGHTGTNVMDIHVLIIPRNI